MKIYIYKSLMTWLPRFLNTFFSLWHHRGSDRPNVRFGRTVRLNFYCAVRPKWQNFFLQNTELFFRITFNANGIFSYFLREKTSSEKYTEISLKIWGYLPAEGSTLRFWWKLPAEGKYPHILMLNTCKKWMQNALRFLMKNRSFSSLRNNFWY